MIQSNLFEQDFVLEANIFQKANDLIDLLNEGLKGNKRYFGTGVYKYKGHFIFQANKVGEKPVFNIIDPDSNTPNNMAVNWRCFSHIVVELNEM